MIRVIAALILGLSALLPSAALAKSPHKPSHKASIHIGHKPAHHKSLGHR